MKKLLSRLALLGLSVVPLLSVRAAFDPALVGSDAQWVLHADLNTLRSSVIGKELVAAVEKMQLDAGDAKVGLDVPKLLTTVGSVTAYGANFAADPSAIDGTLVVRGTADLSKIAEAALLQANLTHPERVTELKGLPFSAYTVAGESRAKDPDAKTVASAPVDLIVAFPPGGTVLVSKSKAQLLKANDVLRGAAPSLAKNTASPLNALLHNAGDAYLFAASVVPPDKIFGADAPQARILQMANAGSIALGESGPLTYAHVELVASNEEMADKLVKILQGMTAMMSLAETSDKQLADFLNSATVKRQDKSVTLQLAYASDRLVQMVNSMRESRPRNLTRGSTANNGNGRVVAEWKAADVSAGADGVMTKTLENVHLKNGTTLAVVAKMSGSKNPQLDRVEIAPVGGAAPMVFRGDYMRLSGWSIDPKPTLSGGKTITARAPTSTARLPFPGVEGDYTVKVVYYGQVPDETSWSVSARDPEVATPAPAPASTPSSKIQD